MNQQDLLNKEITKELAKALKTARLQAGYKTADEFAKKFNISPSTYVKHEAGTRNLTISCLIQYCTWLNLELDIFVKNVYQKAKDNIKII